VVDAASLAKAAAPPALFGRAGTGQLSLAKFDAFIRELHAAMTALEFQHYDAAGRGVLSDANFGLSVVAAAGLADPTPLLARVRLLEASAAAPSITLPQFQAWQALLPRLPELQAAVLAFTANGGALDPAAFTSAVQRVLGIQLAPAVVRVVFAVFDADGDGSLTPQELFHVLEARRRAEHRARRSGGKAAALYECCAECWGEVM
jgi:hypothetical protein